MRLALVETAAQAGAVPQDCEVVALEPEAQVVLAQAGRPFHLPQEYVTWDVLEAAGLATFPIVEQLCDLLDQRLADHVREVRAHALRPARWHLFLCKPAVDEAVAWLLRLRRILEHAQPDEVVYFGSGSIERALDVLGVAATRLQDPALPTPEPNPARHRHGVRSTIGRFAQRRRHAPVVLLDRMYGMPAIARELDARSIRNITLPRPSPVAPRDLGQLWAELAQDEELRALLRHEAGDLWPLVSSRLRDLLEHGVPLVVDRHDQARRFARSIRPNVAVASVVALPEQKATAHAFHGADVRIVVNRHGELGSRHVPMVVYQDVDSVDEALCWGKWEELWIQRHAGRVATRIVGAPQVEIAIAAAPGRDEIRARLGLDTDLPIALYVPTALSRSEWYASKRAPDDSTYFAQQTTVIEALLAAGFHVLVKEHVFGRPSALEYWCAPRDSIDLIYEPRFEHLIHVGDITVLDAPSTTLVEALFGAAPIVIVDHPVFEWEPGVRDHLVAHGVAITLADGLPAVLKDLPVPDYGPEAREPLIASGPEPAAARVADAVIAIASEAR